ncbi:RNA 2',3'-cyclic phosphodiesterase [Alteraurantiacibacter buctensis]|uniref:RNA 2',3'-cyclic phosphodiesterase n=1 Tax=Alteraurantiacibacter buctensis TaxID=1503981 RepID=A0A844YV65_9SPHN|nr:RNA 2',3'-cyclic phosphodiesterase [Alteraurantiacibacter buctensis]MXO71439.1 RNA 2',3'-cyclic phosphodiesterase [Alteraurantiacibacter buctensis]
MPRLFTALTLPEPVSDLLLDTMEGLADARWQDAEQLHLTLTFLGDVPQPAVDDLVLALSRVPVTPFTLTLSGVGHFEHKGRAKALWAGVAPSEPLHALQARVAQACAMAGFPPEARRFLPHVTLARLGGQVPGVPQWLAAHALLAAPPCTVDSFTLFASTLSPVGSHYTPVEQFPVG